MNDLETSVEQLTQLILAGKTLQAMETFYADDVIMQENEDQPRKGKVTCLRHEQENLKKVTSLECKLLGQAIDLKKSKVFSEWEITFTTLTGKRMRLREVSVQQWSLRNVISEKFYYTNVSAV
jgi:hypothetical protein